MTSRRGQAATVVEVIAGRLSDPGQVAALSADPDNVSEVPTLGLQNPWHPMSLADGHPGVAMLFAELAGADRAAGQVAHAHLDAAIRSGVEAGANGLYSGAAALASAVAAAARTSRGYDSALSALDRAVADQADAHVAAERDRRAAGIDGTSLRSFDVISGLTGLGRYLLGRDGVHRDTLDRVLSSLTAIAAPITSRGWELPGWWSLDVPFLGAEAEFPDGHVNVGMAHGIAGPLALLSLAFRQGARVDGHEEAITVIAEWLMRWRGPDPTSPVWPAHLTTEQVSRGPRAAGRLGTRDAWCYGTPGVARALQLAGRALGRGDWADTALAAIRAMVTLPERMSHGVNDAGLCHGWAGLLRITERMASDAATPDVMALRAGAEALVERILNVFDEEAPFGFRYAAAHMRVAPNRPGFLEGAAGVALALHAYATDQHPITEWDAALLLA